MSEVHAYVTPEEAAGLLGCNVRSIDRRVLFEELPALVLSPRIRRIEAQHLVEQGVLERALPAMPDGPAVITIAWLAKLWRIRPQTLRELARAGSLPLRKQTPSSPWTMQRRTWMRFVLDHTTGDS